jgi:hypothetical protein
MPIIAAKWKIINAVLHHNYPIIIIPGFDSSSHRRIFTTQYKTLPPSAVDRHGRQVQDESM